MAGVAQPGLLTCHADTTAAVCASTAEVDYSPLALNDKVATSHVGLPTSDAPFSSPASSQHGMTVTTQQFR